MNTATYPHKKIGNQWVITLRDGAEAVEVAPERFVCATRALEPGEHDAIYFSLYGEINGPRVEIPRRFR